MKELKKSRWILVCLFGIVVLGTGWWWFKMDHSLSELTKAWIWTGAVGMLAGFLIIAGSGEDRFTYRGTLDAVLRESYDKETDFNGAYPFAVQLITSGAILILAAVLFRFLF